MTPSGNMLTAEWSSGGAEFSSRPSLVYALTGAHTRIPTHARGYTLLPPNNRHPRPRFTPTHLLKHSSRTKRVKLIVMELLSAR